MPSKLKQWFKERFKPPTGDLRNNPIVPSSTRPADNTNDGQKAEPQWDDEATVSGGNKDFLAAATDDQVSLPTYNLKQRIPGGKSISFPGNPLMLLDVLLQICADLHMARLILFEIARCGTPLMGRRGGLKLSGAALELDKALCKTAAILKSYAKVGKGLERDQDPKETSQSLANDQQMKDALATVNRTLRRVEKAVRDGVLDTLKMAMIHNCQDIDYDEIRTQTEMHKKEAQDACRIFHGVAGDVLCKLRQD
ncbi:hypothetical protein PG993_005548 [Apiospora rasikravindrae]|uniref:Uncharacterized protein n=1 Tax=Apiospora rasikravindrae TaxID=990691 RepID=A0ABR1TFX2_9PEZI